MNVSIINIGNELLIGQVVNTNASWMSTALNDNGFYVERIITIADAENAIIEAIDNELSKFDIVLLTGGLGPTKDDITKITLAKYFNSELVEDAHTLEIITSYFAARGYELTETNRHQALVPKCCTVIENKVGTAPIMWFEKEGKIIVSMPGVPFEMKEAMTHHVIPMLKLKFETEVIIHKTILTQGIGESFLSDKIEAWEMSLPKNMGLAYLPNSGMVRLRITARGKHKSIVEQQVKEQFDLLYPLISEYIFGYDNQTLEELVGDLLCHRKASLGIAESCTGGNISRLITSIKGSSAYFKGGIIAYSNDLKVNLLGVSASTLDSHGAVSQKTAEEMALGVLKTLGTDFAIATTGIAGPGGGSVQKPVGTVWIAVTSKKTIKTEVYHYSNDRLRTIDRASNQALRNLMNLILAD